MPTKRRRSVRLAAEIANQKRRKSQEEKEVKRSDKNSKVSKSKADSRSKGTKSKRTTKGTGTVGKRDNKKRTKRSEKIRSKENNRTQLQLSVTGPDMWGSVQSIAGAMKMKIGAAQVVKTATSLAKNATNTRPPLLLDLGKENLITATMVCRPSKRNKSPYVADVLLEDGREAIAHVPCLDMGGKCVAGAKLLLKIARDRKGVAVGANALGKYGTPKCEFITQLLWNSEAKYNAWVVAHPSLGEKLSEAIVAANLLSGTDGIREIESFQREVRNICGSNMRTDFVLTHPGGTRSVMEVKTVVDTDISKQDALEQMTKFLKSQETLNVKEDGKSKSKKKTKKLKTPVLFTSPKEPYTRAGIFPWGSCKQIGPDGEKVVSARAIKHVDELRKIARGELREEKSEKLSAAVLFVVGRKDAKYFRPNVDGCASFARHLSQAKDDGVTIMAHKIIWGEKDDVGKAFWGGQIPVEL